MYDEKTRQQNYHALLEAHGNRKQIGKAIEEIDELKKELWSYLTATTVEEKQDAATGIEEESADVYNMINQLGLIFGFYGRVEALADIKTHKAIEDLKRQETTEEFAESL